MRFEEKRVTLKDGRVLLIRPAMPCDAEELIRYLKQTAAETRFLLRYPDEWNLTAEKERELLQGYLDNPSAAMAVAIVMPGAGENGAEASRPDDGSSADSAAADAVNQGTGDQREERKAEPRSRDEKGRKENPISVRPDITGQAADHFPAGTGFMPHVRFLLSPPIQGCTGS